MSTLDKEIEIIMLKGETGGTIDRLEKTATVGNVDTYTIFMTDGSTYTFNVTNGTSISTIEKTATVGKVDTYTITLTDGTTTTFTVTNGEVSQNDLNTKVDKEFVTDNNTQKITNDENGLEITNEYTSSDDYPNSKIKVESGIITLQSESYNNGADDDTYITKVLISDEDILIKRDLGNGEETYSLLTLARRHLYRHDIEITVSSTYQIKVYLTLYLSTDDLITSSSTIIDNVGDNIMCNGYENSGAGINIIYKLYKGGSNTLWAETQTSNGISQTNITGATYDDTVTQVF